MKSRVKAHACASPVSSFVKVRYVEPHGSSGREEFSFKPSKYAFGNCQETEEVTWIRHLLTALTLMTLGGSLAGCVGD